MKKVCDLKLINTRVLKKLRVIWFATFALITFFGLAGWANAQSAASAVTVAAAAVENLRADIKAAELVIERSENE